MFYIKGVLKFEYPVPPLMHFFEPTKEEYSVAVRGYFCVKFEVFTAVFLEIQHIWFVVLTIVSEDSNAIIFRVKQSVLLGRLDSEDVDTNYPYETVYHWTQHNNPEDLNISDYACVGLHLMLLHML
jgi:hypothetical protein